VYLLVERAKIIKNNKRLVHNLELLMIKIVIHRIRFVYHLKHYLIKKTYN